MKEKDPVPQRTTLDFGKVHKLLNEIIQSPGFKKRSIPLHKIFQRRYPTPSLAIKADVERLGWFGLTEKDVPVLELSTEQVWVLRTAIGQEDIPETLNVHNRIRAVIEAGSSNKRRTTVRVVAHLHHYPRTLNHVIISANLQSVLGINEGDTMRICSIYRTPRKK